MTIKAIETRYAGHRMRSRLEARWATFFDALGMKWIYEPEGYSMSFRGRTCAYLPDFFLPLPANFGVGPGIYAEVKGDDTALVADLPKLRTFARESDSPVLILGQVPHIPSTGTTYVPVHSYINQDGFCGEGIWIRHDKVAEGHFFPLFRPTEDEDMGTPTTGVVFAEVGDRPLIPVANAYNAARSARFEHGESGAA